MYLHVGRVLERETYLIHCTEDEGLGLCREDSIILKDSSYAYSVCLF